MGNACIIIRSLGPHQNNRSYDAERIAGRAVDELRSYGHHVLSASVETGGGSIELAPSPHPFIPVSDPDEPGRAAYERYLQASGGKSLISGVDLPGFDALSDAIKSAWRAAGDPAAPRLRR